MKKIYVAQTKNKGKGLFAKLNIKKDDVLFVVKGRMVQDDNYYPGDYYKSGPRWLALEKYTWLVPLRTNLWWFINHSCKPNAGLRGKATVVAMKNIKKGEEITIDYSITEEDPYWKMDCNCGEKNCRKVIKGIKYLPHNFFIKYKLYIPKFLVESYRNGI